MAAGDVADGEGHGEDGEVRKAKLLRRGSRLLNMTPGVVDGKTGGKGTAAPQASEDKPEGFPKELSQLHV